MIDKCEVEFLDPAKRDLRKIGSKHPDRIPFVEHAVSQVLENGWMMATGSRLIRPLRPKKQIGEIRDLGAGGYRLIFFWHDTATTRRLYVTAIPLKSEVQQRARLNTFIEAAIKRRDQFLKEQG